MTYRWQDPKNAPTDGSVVAVKVKGRLGSFVISAATSPSGLQVPNNLSVIAWAALDDIRAANNGPEDNFIESEAIADFQAFDRLPSRLKNLLQYSPDVCSAEQVLGFVKHYGETVTYKSTVKELEKMDGCFLQHLPIDEKVHLNARLRRHLLFR